MAKTRAVQIVVSSFDYSELATVEEREALRAAAVYGHAQDDVIHDALVRKGRMFAAVKEAFAGVWERWVNAEFGMSVDKADGIIAIALNLPAIPDGSDSIWDVRAKLLYARNSTPDEIRALVQQRAAAGVVQDDDEATIMVRAPLYLRARYEREDIPKKQAADCTRVLMGKKVAPSCREQLIEWGVSHPYVVSYLSQAYNDYQATKGRLNARLTWLDVVDDNGVLNGISWSVPVRDANERDIERFNADRQTMHMDKAAETWDWKAIEGYLIHLPDGRVALTLPIEFNPPNAILDVKIKATLRLPRKDK